MTNQGNLLLSPLFRYGIAVVSTLAVVVIAILAVEDTQLRAVMLGVAILDLLVTPQILKRAAEQAE